MGNKPAATQHRHPNKCQPDEKTTLGLKKKKSNQTKLSGILEQRKHCFLRVSSTTEQVRSFKITHLCCTGPSYDYLYKGAESSYGERKKQTMRFWNFGAQSSPSSPHHQFPTDDTISHMEYKFFREL